MSEVDWIIVIILGFSGVISLLRGFVKEALSLLMWVIAFVVAVSLSPKLEYLLAGWFANGTLRIIVAFIGLFVATLIVGGLINSLLTKLVARAGLGPLDRLLGSVFGILRGGILILAVLIIIPLFIDVSGQGWWTDSTLIPHFMKLEGWAKETFGSIAEWRYSLINK